MMAIPLVLMGASLATVVVVIARRFSALSLLDVTTIPGVKEETKKREFLRKKIEKQATETQRKRAEEWRPILEKLKGIQLAFRRYVGRVERMIAREKLRARRGYSAPEGDAPPSGTATELRGLLNDAAFSLAEGNLEEAEKRYLAVIRLDAKHADAYLGLGDVYRRQGQTDEAKETYQFVAQLDPNNDIARMKLAELAEETGDTAEAIRQYEQAVLLNDNIPSRFFKLSELLASLGEYQTAFEASRQAVELEPENPKYLDMLAEVGILSQNKDAARDAYERLRMVNPENQKLAVLKDKIERMPT